VLVHADGLHTAGELDARVGDELRFQEGVVTNDHGVSASPVTADAAAYPQATPRAPALCS
jgi:hypothetical protein